MQMNVTSGLPADTQKRLSGLPLGSAASTAEAAS